MSLPAFFAALSAVAFLLAVAALWRSLSEAYGGDAAQGELWSDVDRGALVDEKKALLTSIKDLEFERSVGRISEADFERLDRAYRGRAKEVLHQLDEELKPFHAKADELLAEVLAQPMAKRAETQTDEAAPQKAADEDR